MNIVTLWIFAIASIFAGRGSVFFWLEESMDLKRLSYFCTVMECGSITKAAQHLHISQPPLSKRLQELEEEIGAPLFLRHAHKIEPTATGMFLYERARTLLQELNSLTQETVQFARQQKKTLKIGISYLYQYYFTPLMVKLKTRYPYLETSVIVSDSSHLEILMQNQTVDIIFVQKPASVMPYHCHYFPTIRLAAIAHKNLVAAHQTHLNFSELNHYPLILLHRISGNGIFEILLDQIRKNGAVPRVLLDTPQPQMAVNLLESGIEAVVLLPESEARGMVLNQNRFLTIEPALQIFHPVMLSLSTHPPIRELEELLAEGF